ncbi:MAG: TldD/PmbA family protein [Chloroherpetonaceae bacterium]|nr:TldD/PmbA family protein [Chloroherpetonaceae bacterium]
MAILTESEAKRILEKALSFSKADECEVNLGGGKSGNIRYARNTISTSGSQNSISLAIQSSFGKRTGNVTTNELTDDAIEKAVRRSEELARLAPENPEFVKNLGKQTYLTSKTHFESTAAITAEYRSKVAAAGITACKANGNLTAAGFFQNNEYFQSMANSSGVSAYQLGTNTEFNLTVRTNDGTGSGYVYRDVNDIAQFDAAVASQIAIEKALQSREPKAIEPGKYTVILEPSALVSDEGLLNQMMFNMDARSAEEGRSFLSKAGGKTKLGEKLIDERITIYSDPTHPDVPAQTWSGDGRPQEKTVWIEKGVVKNLFYSRYWAEKKGVKATPFPSNIIIDGGTASIEDLIKDTKRGILVSRLWYIRDVDPQTLLYTGLTRDGTFFIENGKIAHPIKNLRFNESPIIMLNNLEALGKPMRMLGNWIPPMKIRDFTFTSLSDAV